MESVQTPEKNPNRLLRTILVALWLGLTILVFLRIFMKLGAAPMENTDESWYGVNTCEMLTSGNWIIPTVRHEVDYGSKPPLHLWLVLICYKLLGTSPFSLRLTAAVSTFLAFLLISLILYKSRRPLASVFFAAVFPTIWLCFYLHGFRSGDTDGLFCLLCAVAMIALYLIDTGHPRAVILYGAMLGLAFITKATHVLIPIAFGVILLPWLYRKLRIKELLIAFVAAILPALIWIALTYPYVGFSLFYALTFGESSDRFSLAAIPSTTALYLQDILREKQTWLLLAVVALRIVLALTAGASSGTAKDLPRRFASWCREHAFSLIGFVSPLAIYCVTGCYMLWYTFPAYIGESVLVAVIAAECAELLVTRFSTKGLERIGRAAAVIFCAGILVFCVACTSKRIADYRYLGEGGNLLNVFADDLRDYQLQNGDINRGKRAYYAQDRQRIYGDREHWELGYRFLAYAITGFECVDGGVEAFLEDDDSILVLDGDLWDEYADVLTGHVFLEMNTYFVMNHDYY